MNNCLECVLHLLEQPIRLENVDNADKNQESLALIISGWYAAFHPDVQDVVLVEGARLDALHWGGVGHQLCRVWLERPFPLLIRHFSFIQFSLLLIEVVYAQEERVVHYVEALKNSAVSLNGRHQCCVGFGIKEEAFRDKIQKIQILERWIFLCPFTF